MPKDAPEIFNRALWRRRRERAFARGPDPHFLYQRVFEDVVDRLESVTRRFPKTLLYGLDVPRADWSPASGVEDVIHADIRAQKPGDFLDITADEEAWPFAQSSFDLIISTMTLHWANDLIGALSQMRASLKPDGFFIAAMLGEESLSSLRRALYQAETDAMGGVAARIAPFASVRELGGALQRAGFAMPVADVDRFEVRYRDPQQMFDDFRAMGATNALARRTPPLRRQVFRDALNTLRDNEGALVFDIVFLTGWAPSADQPKPRPRGSATQSLAEAVRDFNSD